MQVFIRLKAGQEDKLSKTLNYTYKPKSKLKVCLTAIPPFISNPKCHICGGNASYMLEDYKLMCSLCFDSVLNGISELQKTEDTMVPLTEDTLKRMKFEWSIDRERWYSIHGSGLKPKNVKSFLLKVKESFISGKMLVVECEYEKETKSMNISN